MGARREPIMSLEDRKKALVQALKDPEEIVSGSASRALDRVEGLARIDRILDAASGGDTQNRIRAIHFLGYLNTTESVGKAISLLQDPDPDIRVATIKSLQVNLPERAFIPLATCLDDPDTSVVQIALETISYYRDTKATDLILPFLASNDTDVAIVAAEALGRNGDPGAEAPLIDILTRATDPFLRARAADALGHLHPFPVRE